MPQVTLLHTWVGEDQCRVNPIERCYLSHIPLAIIIIIIIILIHVESRAVRCIEQETCLEDKVLPRKHERKGLLGGHWHKQKDSVVFT